MQAKWLDNTQRIILITHSPDEDVNDFVSLMPQVNALASSVVHPVWILDTPDKIPLFGGSEQLALLRQAYKTLPDNVIGGAVVINHGITRRIVKTALLLYGGRLQVKICATLDEAKAYIDAQAVVA